MNFILVLIVVKNTCIIETYKWAASGFKGFFMSIL